jgi:hypothetical protein
MKLFYAFLCLAMLALSPLTAQVRMVSVDPANQHITIKNFGAATDISSYRLCALFEYANLNSMFVSIVTGDYALLTDEEVTIQWNASTGFNATASDVGLYLSGGSFADPSLMVDFVQYGAPNLGRQNIAVSAQLWVEGTFITGSGPWVYTGTGAENGVNFWGPAPILGCIALGACNYDANATEDDGSCVYIGFPCDDGNSQTVDFINSDCVCAGSITGCTAIEACNFNPDAVEENFTCVFPNDTCDDGNDMTFNDQYNVDCVCAGELIGCTEMMACNYNANALIDDGSCAFVGDTCDDGDVFTQNDLFTADCICAGEIVEQIFGCTATEACNFNPLATVDDSSCEFPGSPCDDNNPSTENDLLGADCLCVGILLGCTEASACNYNPDADFDDFSCLFPGDPCDDGLTETVNDLYDNNCGCSGIIPDIPGCMQADACNYNSDATIEDGSCAFPGSTCDDGDIFTVNEILSADCICLGDTITGTAGCTAIEACNFNPAATIEDGSCELPGFPCDDNNAATSDDVLSAECTCVGLLNGCANPDACNYTMDAVIDDGSCQFPGEICDDGDATTINDVLGSDCVCAGEPQILIEGCTAIEACNFNPAATIDDGSCDLPGYPCDDLNDMTANDAYTNECACAGVLMGCTNSLACNYNQDAILDDNSCTFPGDSCDDGDIFTTNETLSSDCVCLGDTITGIPGCTAIEACNYDSLATIEDGSCELPGYDCDDNDSNTINDTLTADCQCIGTLIGCTNQQACNYNADALIDNGECFFVGDPCDDNNLTTDNDVISAECGCAGVDNGNILGCRDTSACNYNVLATIEDGSCILIGSACDDGNINTINDVIGDDCACAGDVFVEILGCTASEACNFNPDATIEDGSCILPGFPCDDNDSNTFSDAYGFDCICAGLIMGCTDTIACNFNPLAQFEDFTCEFPGSPCDDGNSETLNDFLDNDCNCIGQIISMLGCTDMDACNYDMSANTDDGSCYFVGDACDDGDASTTEDAYNANCECEGVTSVDEISAFYSVYPNPTKGMITIAQRQGVAIQLIEVVDITGKRVATFNPNASMTVIDLGAIAQGLYTLNIHSNNEVKSVRVQKN